MKLLRLEFKLDNTIKSKTIKDILEKILPHYEENCLVLLHLKTMETYCVTCKKNTASKNSSVWRTKQNKLNLVSICDDFEKKKSSYIRNQKASRLELY